MGFTTVLRMHDGTIEPRAAIICDACKDKVGLHGVVISARRMVNGVDNYDGEAKIIATYCNEACRQKRRQAREVEGGENEYHVTDIISYVCSLMLFVSAFRIARRNTARTSHA